jgi:hypothetical protein
MEETLESKGDFDEEEKPEPQKLTSAIAFTLPYAMIDHLDQKGGKPSFIYIVGNGLSVGDVYFMQRRYNEASRLWRLFSYHGPNEKPQYKWRKEPKSLINLKKYFTTEISPFLKDGQHPLYGTREYMVDLTCVGTGYINVIAESKKDRTQQTCTIKYVPDGRDGKPKTLLELKHIDWEYYAPELERMVSTTNFKT